MPDPLWYDGLCDRILNRIQQWKVYYAKGEVCKDQDYMQQDGQVVKMPTMYAHRIPWTLAELNHLIKIMKTLRPKDPLTKEISLLPERWRKGRLLPNHFRLMTLAFYEEHVQQLIEVLNEAKTGQAAVKVDELIQKQQQKGKDLFEI